MWIQDITINKLCTYMYLWDIIEVKDFMSILQVTYKYIAIHNTRSASQMDTYIISFF